MKLCVLLAVAGSCTTTHVTRSWTKPGAGPARIQRIAVLALLQEENKILRRVMEDAIVQELTDRGYAAYLTYAEFGLHALIKATSRPPSAG